LELALLLEASAHKPGNVSIVTDFENTRYEHFLASAVAVAPHFEQAAQRGTTLADGTIAANQIRVGQIIRDCVVSINEWQHGGNTLLGAVILLSPIAVAAGMAKGEKLDLQEMRKNLRLVAESTTPQDAVDVYEAIRLANPAGLGKAPRLDVNDPSSTRRMLEERTTLYQVFKIAESYDTICSEWVNNYQITFKETYPLLSRLLHSNVQPAKAILHTFLEILSRHPDTFIARKGGLERARAVSAKARGILDVCLETVEGRRMLDAFDFELRQSGNLLNPGTTADLIAVGLALCVLGGYRP
jgi:triphosphoribosyl-dephospho-CoA synthase